MLNELCTIIDLKKKEYNGRILIGFVATLVKSHTVVCHWITRDTINNELRRHKGADISSSVQAPRITTGVIDVARTDYNSDNRKGGRPVGNGSV